VLQDGSNNFLALDAEFFDALREMRVLAGEGASLRFISERIA